MRRTQRRSRRSSSIGKTRLPESVEWIIKSVIFSNFRTRSLHPCRRGQSKIRSNISVERLRGGNIRQARSFRVRTNLSTASVFRELLSEKPSRCFAAKGSFERHADMGLESAPLTTGTFSIRTSFAGMTQEVRKLREFMRKQPTSD